MDTLVNNREEFEKWYQEHIGDLYTKDLPIGANNTWLAWQEATERQQKIIDELKALNPDVPCPAIHQDKYGYNCAICGTKGTVPLTKAQEYRIKELGIEDRKDSEERTQVR